MNPALTKLAQARPPAWIVPTPDCISDLRVASHGHTIFATSLSGTLVCLETKTGHRRWQAEAHPLGALWCAPHPTQSLVASGGQDGVVKIWEANKGTLLHTLPLDKKAWAEHGAWSHDGTVLAASAGKKVWFWAPDGPLLGQTTEHSSTVLCLDWHPRKLQLLTGSNGGARLFDPNQVKPLEEIPWPSACLAIRWSPNGRFIAAGNQDQTVHAWPAGTQDHLRMAGYATKLRELDWRCDSSALSTGGGYNLITWNFRGAGPSGSTPEEHCAHSEFITAVAAHPQVPEICASTAQDQFLFLWRDGDPNPIWIRAVATSPATCLRWHPEGSMLFAGGQTGEVVAWKVVVPK